MFLRYLGYCFDGYGGCTFGQGGEGDERKSLLACSCVSFVCLNGLWFLALCICEETRGGSVGKGLVYIGKV